MKKHSNRPESIRNALRRKFKQLECEIIPPKGIENSILLKIAEKRKKASQLFFSGSHGRKYFLEED